MNFLHLTQCIVYGGKNVYELPAEDILFHDCTKTRKARGLKFAVIADDPTHYSFRSNDPRDPQGADFSGSRSLPKGYENRPET